MWEDVPVWLSAETIRVGQPTPSTPITTWCCYDLQGYLLCLHRVALETNHHPHQLRAGKWIWKSYKTSGSLSPLSSLCLEWHEGVTDRQGWPGITMVLISITSHPNDFLSAPPPGVFRRRTITKPVSTITSNGVVCNQHQQTNKGKNSLQILEAPKVNIELSK